MTIIFEFVFTCKNCKNKKEQSISDRGWYFRKLHKQKTLKKARTETWNIWTGDCFIECDLILFLNQVILRNIILKWNDVYTKSWRCFQSSVSHQISSDVSKKENHKNIKCIILLVNLRFMFSLVLVHFFN